MFFGFILFIIPGIILSLMYSQALYVTPYCGTTLVNFYTDLMEDYRGKEITL